MTPAELHALAGGWPAVLRWTAVRAVTGAAAFAAIVFALALIPGA